MSGASEEGYRNDTENRAIANVMRERRKASFTIPGRLAGMNEFKMLVARTGQKAAK